MLYVPNQVNKYWKRERYLNVTAMCVSLIYIYGGERDFGQQFTFIQGFTFTTSEALFSEFLDFSHPHVPPVRIRCLFVFINYDYLINVFFLS